MSSITIPSPIGPIHVTAAGATLHSIRLLGLTPAMLPPDEDRSDPLLREAEAQITAWFAHRLTDFDLPLLPLPSVRGNALRAAICAIPYGMAASYGTVARQAESGPRAIGQACRRNPYPLLVPCHRVIGAGQTIGHYSAADGIITKQWLLDHEQRQSQREIT